MVSRDPPTEILRALRREVNFGCPVQDCGVPYLTWHHFDPPWTPAHKHNREGMIALCTQHADFADGGRYTNDQLREMKRNPYVTEDRISADYGYLRKDTVCWIGNIAFDVKNVLQINGERVVGFEKDPEGYYRLNVLIRDKNGDEILGMVNNYWTVYTQELFDIICTARGKELSIISKDGATHFSMRFDDYPLKQFGTILHERGFRSNDILHFLSSIGAPPMVSVWKITGDLVWKNYRLRIEDSKATEMSRSISVVGSFVKGQSSALSFDHGTMSFG